MSKEGTMRVRTLLVAAVIALTASCASKTYTHDDPRMRGNFARELQKCKAEATQIAAGVDPGNLFIIKDEMENCMESKGYYEVDE